jgi:hypothetical protein
VAIYTGFGGLGGFLIWHANDHCENMVTSAMTLALVAMVYGSGLDIDMYDHFSGWR